jgi:hypothetical protein
MTNFKTEITVHLNTLLIKELEKVSSAWIDEVLSNYFGVTYETAYPGCNEGKWQGVIVNARE